ncbi:DMT family transporter [Flavobacterium agrisoli]|uniref:DMT family transporter n=1 Tax=Flavobacterium agrisoli TaxID=2793066 RepID=A0A934UJI4_9FLAO|nr:DMT family transporter [Flavobacterium agrisoli]MBK0369450.1 DMT family transporter [Flavobacterium agrisoli]
MKNTKPRLALAAGIICISIFPILVRLQLSPALISAFYRMFFSAAVLVPFVLITGKFKKPAVKNIFLSLLCGLIFASDVAVWNIAIQESSATQATLLTNLSPVWVGIGSFLFLPQKPKRNFWIGTVVALIGMVLFVGVDFFAELRFNRAFFFAILSGVLYAFYMLISKTILRNTAVLSFMTLSLIASSLFLGVVCFILNEPFTGFSQIGWISLAVQALVCQLSAWLLISFATQNMRATRVSLSLLGQAVLTTIIAWVFLNEQITIEMIVGGLVLLLGIRITFIEKPISL